MRRRIILRIGIVAAALLGLDGSPAAAQPERRPIIRWMIDESVFDLTYWQSVQNSRDPQDFRSYLEQFPDGRFAALARNRLRALSSAATPEPEPVERAPRASLDGTWRGRTAGWTLELAVMGGDVRGTVACGNTIYRVREHLDASENLTGSATRLVGGNPFPTTMTIRGAFPGVALSLSGMPGGCANGGRATLQRSSAG